MRRKDWSAPLEVTVSFDEFNRNQATWKQMPGGMIEVRAITQAHRRAFPNELEGLYKSDLTVEVGEEISVANKSLPEPELHELFPAKEPVPTPEPTSTAPEELVEAPEQEKRVPW